MPLRSRRAVALAGLLAASVSVRPAAAADPAASSAKCNLAQADLVANSKLDWTAFDHGRGSPTTFNSLADRGCDAQAARAAEDYLVRGPVAGYHEQQITLFHLGQALAGIGQEREAARVIVATRSLETSGRIDSNDYVAATCAFLINNGAMFDTAAAGLALHETVPDRTNGAIVAGMGRCFAKPYSVAYDPQCGILASRQTGR